ncbi:MAG: VOC family protein [Planctomycetaceae bacterium]
MNSNPGRFVWHDLMTTNAARSIAFYGQLFPEWAIEGVDTGGSGDYRMVQIQGVNAGGIVSIPDDAGIPSHWVGYVSVADCDAIVDRVQAAGGELVIPPHTAPGVGRFAVVADPVGAMVKPFQVDSKTPLPDGTSSGHFAWDVLLSNNVPVTQRFYQSVFGWSVIERPVEGPGTYTLFRVDERDTAGCIPLPAASEGNPAWLTCLYAEDIDDRTAKAESLGAQVIGPPQDLAGVGRLAVLSDPDAALFALFRRPVSSGD